MIHDSSERKMQLAKSQARGVSCDMSPEAVIRRLDIVDELRDLAQDLQNAKRLGSLMREPIVTQFACLITQTTRLDRRRDEWVGLIDVDSL